MSKKDFDKFLDKQVKLKQTEKTVDWNLKRDKWLNNLTNFYNQINIFLEEYVSKNKIKCIPENISIFEDNIGNYTAKSLNIEMGNRKAKLQPIGTNVICAKGRVDLIGPNGKVKFVLVNKNPEKSDLEWEIATPPPQIEYIDLKQDTFLDALMEVTDA